MRGIGKIWVSVFFMLAFSSLKVQGQNLWADVSMNRSSTYLGQPVEVSITVYTSTWFTTGLDLGNIKVEGAFTVYFRPVTTSFNKEGKTFAGVKQIYHVFPYTDKDITFPELDIEVESPAPGDYKGKKHIVKTQPKRINVKPIPSKFAASDWLVASGLSVTERWSGDRSKVKVGDVLVRTISRNAAGTVSELIPPVQWDSVTSVSLYPSRSQVENNKTKTDISASRTENMRYLFEEEGEVILPEMVFTWYNPYQNQLYKRTLKEVKIQVEANPDLGVLASVRDSLATMQEEVVADQVEEQPLTILGMSPEKFAGLLIIAVLGLMLLIKVFRKVSAIMIKRRADYLVSEAYYFHEFKKALHSKDQKSISVKLYRWIDALKLDEPSVAYLSKVYGSEALQRQVHTMESKWDKGNQFADLEIKEWESARNNYLNRGVVVDTAWINPVINGQKVGIQKPR